MKMNKTIILLAVIALVATGSYFVFAQDPMGGGMMGGGMMGGGMMGGQQSAWKAPPAAAGRSNPVPADPESVAAGETLFNRYCASCHGMNGKGNNGAAADLTSQAVQNQSDGALFWKISQGHSPMPSFANTLTAHQGWDIINYIRTLASAPAQSGTAMMQPGMGGGMRGRGMMGGGMQGRGMMGGGMMGWGDGMMGPMMRSASVVATADGGAVVLMGGELFKYDKDLNLAKKAEISFDWDNWEKVMMQHRYMMMGLSQQPGSQSSQGE
jgi:mono/diheme cytochrome c family protein